MTVKVPWRLVRPRCPSCETPLLQVRLDLEQGRMFCQACDAALDPSAVIRPSMVGRFAMLIPEDRREGVLRGIGFERKPAAVNPKLAVAFFLVALVASLPGDFRLAEGLLSRTALVVTCLGSLVLVILSYRQDKIGQWQRIRSPEPGAPEGRLPDGRAEA